MRLFLVLFDMILGNVPITFATRLSLGIARRAVKRSAMKELLQAMPVLRMQLHTGAGEYSGLVSTFIAGLIVELGD